MSSNFLPPTLLRIPQLLLQLIERKLLIPRFQRDFVWSDSKRLELLDSVNRGVPIGALMVWTTDEELDAVDQVGPWHLRAAPPTTPSRGYVIDGHQRLVTMLSALGGGLLRAQRSDIMTWEPPDDSVRWRAFCDLRENEMVLERRGREPLAHWLPLDMVLSPVKLGGFQRTLKDPSLVERADEVAGRFKDYTAALHPMVGVERAEAQEYFERINRTGTRVSYVDLVHARIWSRSIDLRGRIEALQSEVAPLGWSDLDDRVLLDVARLLADRSPYASRAGTFEDDLKKDPRILDEAHQRVVHAVRFFSERCLIAGPRALPYLHQLELVAIVATPKMLQAPDVRDILAKWVTATTLAEYFPSKRRVPSARAELEAWVANGGFSLRDAPRISPLSHFNPNSARGVGFLLSLLRRAPLAPDQKTPVSPISLGRLGPRMACKLFSQKELGARSEAIENLFLAEPEAFEELRRLLRKSISSCSEEFLRSHAIEPDFASSLREGPPEVFLHARARLLHDAERDEVVRLGLDFDAP